jgi:CRP/FNR family transcriptional regulator
MAVKKYKAGSIICQENAEGKEMYVIQSGAVKVYKTINAKKIELIELHENDFFGEMCLLLGGFRTATVEAVKDTVAAVLNKEDFLKKVQSDIKFADRILLTLAKRVKGLHRIITNLEGEKKSLEIIYGVK